MDLLDNLLLITDAFLILALVPMLIFLRLGKAIRRDRIPYMAMLNAISWIILVYAIASLGNYVWGLFTVPEEYAIVQRASGPYAFAYWIMVIMSGIFPLILLKKKYRTRYWLVLLLAFSLKIGTYFEQLVLLTTGWHRDYSSEAWLGDFLTNIVTGSLKYFFIALLWLAVILVIVEINKVVKKPQL